MVLTMIMYWRMSGLGTGLAHTSDICERLNEAEIGLSNSDCLAISAYVLSIM